MAIIRIPEPLRKYTDNQKKIETHVASVGSALIKLTEQFPELHDFIFNDQGLLQQSIHIFLNKKDIRCLQGFDTPLNAEDTLIIVMGISGGSSESISTLEI